eukprot:3187078-Amphidinium_carterae.2
MRRRKRRGGWGVTGPNLPSIAEEEWETVLGRVDAVLLLQCRRDDRIISTQALRAMGDKEMRCPSTPRCSTVSTLCLPFHCNIVSLCQVDPAHEGFGD